MVAIRWKDIKASPATASHLESKLSKVVRFKNVNKENIKAEIAFLKKEEQYNVHLSIPTTHKTIVAEFKSSDVLTSINKSIDRALDQLRRLKTQRLNRKTK